MINDNVRISGFKDFYERRQIILGRYQRMNPNDKIIYKYYIYSRRFISERLCDAIWEYLNAASLEELSDASAKLAQGFVKHCYEVEEYDDGCY